MERFYISNNMFGDTLWSLAYYLQFCDSDSRLVCVPGSTLERLSVALSLNSYVDVAPITFSEKIKLNLARRIGDFLYNKVQVKIIRKYADRDLAYPSPNKSLVQEFASVTNLLDGKHDCALKYLEKDTRFYTFCFQSSLDLSCSHLSKIIRKKIEPYVAKQKINRDYVVVNIKPKTYKQRFGMKGTFRTVTTFKDMRFAIDSLKASGLAVLNIQKKEWDPFSIADKVVMPQGMEVLENFIYVMNSKFCVSSRSGFTIIPALLGIPCLELNTIDLPAAFNSRGYFAIGNIYDSRCNQLTIDEVFRSDFFYNTDSNNIPGYTQHKLSPASIKDAIDNVVLDLNRQANCLQMSSKYSTPLHLFLHYTPQKIYYGQVILDKSKN